MVFVEVNNLVKKYDDFEALHIDNIEIPEGKMTGLLGPNGAGKSTLISILSGLAKADGGVIHYDGQEYISPQKVGYIPQDIALYEELNSIDNLHFFGSMYVSDRKLVKSKVKEILNMVGLTDKAKKAVQTYSGGMKRRINIGAALVHDPDLLFFDEPTVGIDPQSRNYIYEIIEKLKESGKTLVYTTHYMEEVEKLCDYIYIIDEGKVILKGETKDILKSLGLGVLELSFHPSNKSEKEIIERIEEVSDVKLINAINEVYYFSIHRHMEDVTSEVLDKLKESKIEIDNLNYSSPNLETLFLILTGKALREG